MSFLLNKITIVGVGLIGGSFAKGLKKSGLVKEVCGFGRNEENLKKAVELGVIDHYTMEASDAFSDTDLVMLAVPVGAMSASLLQLKPFISDSTIITDAGSSKMSVLQAVKSVFGNLPKNFVAGHPIAGKEQSGVTAACDDLYQDHRVILTPTEETDDRVLEIVTKLWLSLGAQVSTMAPDYHDEVLAATSHLPHLLAYGLVDLLNEHHELGDVFQYTAGGFRDFTRIASSDAVMWRDIALNNKPAILKWINNYQAALNDLSVLLENDDGDALYQLFVEAKQARDTHILKINDSPSE